MIGHTDIQRAVSRLLKQKGYLVLARESIEGGKRPAASVDVFPSKSEWVGEYMVEDTFSVEVVYYPKTETQEQLAKAAAELKNILLFSPLEIEDRVLHTYEINFSKNNNQLVAEVDYEISQEVDLENEDDETMEELITEIEN